MVVILRGYRWSFLLASPIVAVEVRVGVVAGQSTLVVAVPTVASPLPPAVTPTLVDPTATPAPDARAPPRPVPSLSVASPGDCLGRPEHHSSIRASSLWRWESPPRSSSRWRVGLRLVVVAVDVVVDSFVLALFTRLFRLYIKHCGYLVENIYAFWAIFVSSWILENKNKSSENLGIENGGLLNEIWTPN